MASGMGLVMRRVTEPETIRQVCIYRPAVRSLPPAAEAFAEFLADWLRAWQAVKPARTVAGRRRLSSPGG
jgi:DNA-binding transcriptional LysR family regulator